MRRRRLSFVEAFRSATSSRSQSRTSLNLEDDEEEDSIGAFGTASRSKAFGKERTNLISLWFFAAFEAQLLRYFLASLHHCYALTVSVRLHS